MRIIAGRLKNRELGSPRSRSTHPMSEQIRGAIFNTLGDITDLTVLDAFAGSGAVGLEAISRGASQATFIESDKRAQLQIADNIASLALGSDTKLIKTAVKSWLDTADDRFDIIIIDPPFHDLQLPAVEGLTHHIAQDGTIVLSWPGRDELPNFEGLTLVKSAAYGDAQLGYYQP